MKNIVILYWPPFRNVTFPTHILQKLNGYRFFILLIEPDFEHHKKLIGINCIEDIIPVKFELDNLVRVCDGLINKYGEISNIVYLAEECVQLSGKLRKHYGLSTDNLDRFIDKDLMIDRLKSAGMRVPISLIFDDRKYNAGPEHYFQELEQTLGKYPFFIKPTNLCGSVDTCKVNNQEEFIIWAAHKQDHSYLVQEYINGTLFHCESFIKNHQILHCSVFEYSSPGFSFSKGSPVGSLSLPPNNLHAQRVSEFTKEVLKNLGIIESGVAHVEIFLNDDDELIFLEAAARPPGLVGDLLYQKHLNLSITETHLQLQLGECNYDFNNPQIDNYAARYIFPFPSTGKISKLRKFTKLNSMFSESNALNVGSKVAKSRDLFNVAGTMVLWNKDYELLREDFIALKDYIPIEIESEYT